MAETALARPVDPFPYTDALRTRGISEHVWSTMVRSLYPDAQTADELMAVLDWCAAARVDPMTRAVHLVPMEVRDRATRAYVWRTVIMLGVNYLRIRAMRTGEYQGRSEPLFGPEMDYRGLKVPEWVQMTFLRFNVKAPEHPLRFTVRVYFREVVALNREGKPNARWAKAPIQMLCKCCESAGLREAFPEECSDLTAEEMDGKRRDGDEDSSVTSIIDAKPVLEPPSGYPDWLLDLEAAADEGTERLQDTWRKSAPDCRNFLTTDNPTRWTTIKERAAAVTAAARMARTPEADPEPAS